MRTHRLIARHQVEAILSRIHIENPESMEEKRQHKITNNHVICLRMKPEREVSQKFIHNSQGE